MLRVLGEYADRLRGDDATVGERIERLTARADRIDAALEAAAALERARAARAEAEAVEVTAELEPARESHLSTRAARDQAIAVQSSCRDRLANFAAESGRLPGLLAELEPLQGDARQREVVLQRRC